MSSPVAEFRGVSKSYPIYSRPTDRLRELLSFQRKSFHRDFWALKDVTFNVNRGETFCIIGENGSGKSTLLQILAGILEPTAGDVQVHGRVSALLELGAGFNPEFTGRDNVYLNGAILGFSRPEMERKFPAIEQFAEIGAFIDQPVKTYSSGMIVRLAFAVAIHVDPDILLVDEALAVGDIYFRQRCMRKVHELRSRGVTILFVSHSMGDVKAIGDRALWLDGGHVRGLGPTDEVVTRYLAAMTAKDSAYIDLKQPSARPGPMRSAPEVLRGIPNVDHRHGNGRAEILGIGVFDQQGDPLQMLTPDSRVTIRISFEAKQTLQAPNVGFLLRNHLGVDFAGTNTLREGVELPPMGPGDVYTVDFHVDLPTLYPAHFSFSPAVADGTLLEHHVCDWIDNAITLQTGHAEGVVYGYIHLPCKVEVNAALKGARELTLG